ncbi:MAG: hypothetical protein JWN33_268 [Candidatus Saccharibacteria bacterium]|nr:hypothetical protein [Candidatus Saccharibacteria bacterium]
MKLNKKLIGLLAIPVIAGVIGAVALSATATHAESQPVESSQQDVAEPGDTQDSPAEDNDTIPDAETND